MALSDTESVPPSSPAINNTQRPSFIHKEYRVEVSFVSRSMQSGLGSTIAARLANAMATPHG
jgi:hypothetical protein